MKRLMKSLLTALIVLAAFELTLVTSSAAATKRR